MIERLQPLPVETQAALAVWANLVPFAEKTKRLKSPGQVLCSGDRDALTQWTAKGIEGLLKHSDFRGRRYLFKRLNEYIKTGITYRNCTLIGLILEPYQIQAINPIKLTDYFFNVG